MKRREGKGTKQEVWPTGRREGKVGREKEI